MAENGLLVFEHEKNDTPTVVTRRLQAQLLRGAPVVKKLWSWCQKHNKPRHCVKPTLAVVYFDTGDDADEYLFVKRLVAAKAGVGYTVHKLLPDATMDEVQDKISELNNDDDTHGILIQRPVPEHLWTEKVMGSVAPLKHIEETARGKSNNIAVDALMNMLQHYRKDWMLDLNIILLGGLNIITPAFKAQLKHRCRHVVEVQVLDAEMIDTKDDTVIITELNEGHIIKPGMLGPAIKLIVDLGFDPDAKAGDLDPDVLDMEGLLAVPTPGGVLPVLLWTMMERTIRARDQLDRTQISCVPKCTVL